VLEKEYYGNLLVEERLIGKKAHDLSGYPRLLEEVKKIWPHGFSDHAVLNRYNAVIAMLERKGINHEYPKFEGDFLDLLLATLVEEYGDFNKIKSQKIESILEEHLGWQLWQNFCKDFPVKIRIPSGREIEIHYEYDRDPWIEAKLQEFFSAKESPTISPHRIKITIHLLSPAGRPLQVTSDLSGFWQGSYREVQKQMKSRYPRHPWPDNPEQHPPIIKGRVR
jgi:ATP-dependent helicase HrpB